MAGGRGLWEIIDLFGDSDWYKKEDSEVKDVAAHLRWGIRVFLEEVGKEVSLLLQYEHLPNFYYACTIIGIAKMKYGPWLKVPVLKN
ncbi:hypothetical protein PanWU01x14_092390 [Parasponia andersonii]|uniref:Uncharacterized protein n=1 Tax=Parasponia andersonii TaxID=3476 RepID=A0A2P5D6I7_PARAD|nr:hypothetical protein PanWU01x14_092390 [Parasponia andersonii]